LEVFSGSVSISVGGIILAVFIFFAKLMSLAHQIISEHDSKSLPLLKNLHLGDYFVFQIQAVVY
jgi:hypothetical protein